MRKINNPAKTITIALSTIVAVGTLGACDNKKIDIKPDPTSINVIPEKPNIIWIMTDEQNTLTMSSYDDANQTHLGDSPNLDRMASEGTLFMNHYVQCPQCVATRAAMLTGSYPHQTGVINNNACLTDWKYDYETIPEVFSKNGYNTANIGKIHYPKGKEIWGYNDTHYGYYSKNYVSPENLTGSFKGQDKKWEVLKVNGYNLILSGIYPEPNEGDDYPETALMDKSIEWLEENKDKEDPFLLRISILSPHAPFLAPLDYYNRYKPEDMVSYDKPSSKTLALLPKYERSKGRSFSEDVVLRTNSTYYGLTSHVDNEIGRLDKYLKESGLDKNTLILFTSDHGHFNGEFNLYGKGEYYDQIMRVPTFIKGPGIEAKKKIDYFTESIDIGRTLMEYAGIKVPEQFTLSSKNMLEDTKRTEVIGEIVLGADRRSWIRTKDYSLDFTYMNFKGYFPDNIENDDARWRTATNTQYDGKLIDLNKDSKFHNNVFNVEEYEQIKETLIARLKERLAERSVPAWAIFTNAQITSSKPLPTQKPDIKPEPTNSPLPSGELGKPQTNAKVEYIDDFNDKLNERSLIQAEKYSISNSKLFLSSTDNGKTFKQWDCLIPDLHYDFGNHTQWEFHTELKTYYPGSTGDSPWKATMIGCRVQNTKVSIPNSDDGFWVAFTSRDTVSVFPGGSSKNSEGWWPAGAVTVNIPEGFSEMHKVIVVDTQNSIFYYIVKSSGETTLILRADISEENIKIYDGNGTKLKEVPNYLPESGGFKIFNHLTATVIEKVQIKSY